MMSRIAILFLVVASLRATTLERLSVDDMISKSTSIVRGTVLDSSCFQRGSLNYTSYRIRVAESLKGQNADVLSVAVPGGTCGSLRQVIPGAPSLAVGQEFVLFIWTGASGIHQILGLSQGLFSIKTETKGELILSRSPIEVEMVDSRGQQVADRGVSISLRELGRRVRQGGDRQ